MGDLDVDILGSTGEWFENTDGLGNFSARRLTDDAMPSNSYSQLEIGDIDQDGDLDVLASSAGGEQIVWHENDDDNFLTHVIAAQFDVKRAVLSDLDSDGDLDVISVSRFSVNWFQNENGQFSPQETLISDRRLTGSFVVADVDSDSDLDIVVRQPGNTVGCGGC